MPVSSNAAPSQRHCCRSARVPRPLVAWFLDAGGPAEFRATGLPKDERRAVHNWCERRGLHSASHEEPGEPLPILVVSREKPAPPKRLSDESQPAAPAPAPPRPTPAAPKRASVGRAMPWAAPAAPAAAADDSDDDWA